MLEVAINALNEIANINAAQHVLLSVYFGWVACSFRDLRRNQSTTTTYHHHPRSGATTMQANIERDRINVVRLILRWANEYHQAGDQAKARWFFYNGAALVARDFPDMSVAEFQLRYDVYTGNVSAPVNSFRICC